MIYKENAPLIYRAQLNNKSAFENYKAFKENMRRGTEDFPAEELEMLIEKALTDILDDLKPR